ncbi:uncharacterized protein C8orf74 homolog isoform X1 [Scophthalmus maximus]|uniref:uncharacterized protein C8orf74 homolog isoform X1 n=1 Tax=Scophthalmus maximus TaxID=52904 RepID=UPI001FA93579|nr:uncharacterized protein C8orf74 homolog isoform X1 [Scophthalmus maximus]
MDSVPEAEMAQIARLQRGAGVQQLSHHFSWPEFCDERQSFHQDFVYDVAMFAAAHGFPWPNVVQAAEIAKGLFPQLDGQMSKQPCTERCTVQIMIDLNHPLSTRSRRAQTLVPAERRAVRAVAPPDPCAPTHVHPVPRRHLPRAAEASPGGGGRSCKHVRRPAPPAGAAAAHTSTSGSGPRTCRTHDVLVSFLQLEASPDSRVDPDPGSVVVLQGIEPHEWERARLTSTLQQKEEELRSLRHGSRVTLGDIPDDVPLDEEGVLELVRAAVRATEGQMLQSLNREASLLSDILQLRLQLRLQLQQAALAAGGRHNPVASTTSLHPESTTAAKAKKQPAKSRRGLK